MELDELNILLYTTIEREAHLPGSRKHLGVVDGRFVLVWGVMGVKRSVTLRASLWFKKIADGNSVLEINPEAEHVTFYNPEWRIVSDALADAVDARFADERSVMN
jgi:hypothetical protein